jgi:TRAP-type C4-dicarboxylate transport system substrate-binding protein
MLLDKAASASAQYQKKLWKEATLKALREVEKAGVEISYPDKSQFKAKVQGIFDEYRSQPALYKIIEDIQAVK